MYWITLSDGAQFHQEQICPMELACMLTGIIKSILYIHNEEVFAVDETGNFELIDEG